MKRILFVLMLGIGGVAIAQDETFTFDYLEDKLDESDLDPIDVRKNYFGDAVARKMALLANDYTWLQEATPTNPVPQRITEKYWVYNSIKRLYGYYKKAAKKKTMSEEAALNSLVKAVDVGLCIRYQDTQRFEEYLESIRDDEQLAAVFAESVYLDGHMEYAQAITDVND